MVSRMWNGSKLLVSAILFCQAYAFCIAAITELNQRKGSKYGEEDRATVDQNEASLLKMFGLQRRPTPKKNQTAPAIMQHLYKAHLGDEFKDQENLLKTWEIGFDLPPGKIRKISNTIRSLHHSETEEIFPGSKHGHFVRLKFNVSQLPDHEILQASELLLHRRGLESSALNLQKMNVYEITKSLSKRSMIDEKRKTFLRLISSRTMNATNTTWERFDISSLVKRWRLNKAKNDGLLIEVTQNGNEGAPPNDEIKTHVRLRRDISDDELDDQEWQHQRPILLTYLHDGKNTSLEAHGRSRRSNIPKTNGSSTNVSRRKKKRDANSRKKNRKRKKRDKICHRSDLYVDFKSVGWSDWIVAPHGYYAYYCQGVCSFPLSRYMNATNHAVVQTLVNDVDKTAAPRTCCVPTKLGEISMLYLDDSDQVVLKTYPEMVADECGCR